MKTLTFGCVMHYGKLDASDWEEDFELTDEEYDRLVEAMKKCIEEGKEDFFGCKEIEDIYYKIYDQVVDIATDNMREFEPELIEDYLAEEEDANEEDFRADEIYPIDVHFPRELFDEMMYGSDEEE